MATVRLGLYELEEYDLPRVCMCCGARARHIKTKNFRWSPPWAFFALGALGAMIFSKKATVDIPLCDKHKWHWGFTILVVFLGLSVLILLGLAIAAVASVNEDLAPFVLIPFGLIFLGWLGWLIYLSTKQIRATEITDKSITLRGVCEEFKDALEEARRGDSDRSSRGRSRGDDDDRPRKRRRSDDDDDDPHVYDPKRRRRKDNADD